MDLFINGSIDFSLKIEEVSCFYFCDRFYKTFKKKQSTEEIAFLSVTHSKELLADGWHANSFRLWPQTNEVRKHF